MKIPFLARLVEEGSAVDRLQQQLLRGVLGQLHWTGYGSSASCIDAMPVTHALVGASCLLHWPLKYSASLYCAHVSHACTGKQRSSGSATVAMLCTSPTPCSAPALPYCLCAAQAQCEWGLSNAAESSLSR